MEPTVKVRREWNQDSWTIHRCCTARECRKSNRIGRVLKDFGLDRDLYYAERPDEYGKAMPIFFTLQDAIDYVAGAPA